MKKKNKKPVSSRGSHFLYHCDTCRDVVVAESQYDGEIPALILCFATPKCKGRMVLLGQDIKVNLPQTVYFYVWGLNDDGVLSLSEMPGRPRFKFLFIAMQRIFEASRKASISVQKVS